MNMKDRITIMEVRLKYVERTMYGIIAALLAQIGVNFV